MHNFISIHAYSLLQTSFSNWGHELKCNFIDIDFRKMNAYYKSNVLKWKLILLHKDKSIENNEKFVKIQNS